LSDITSLKSDIPTGSFLVSMMVHHSHLEVYHIAALFVIAVNSPPIFFSHEDTRRNTKKRKKNRRKKTQGARHKAYHVNKSCGCQLKLHPFKKGIKFKSTIGTEFQAIPVDLA
jgi:hypothetical protein